MLPPFNDKGDLPPGIHLSSMEEIANRLGTGSDARRRLLAKLRHLLELAERTGKLSRLLIFGSFVSNAESPRDIDIVLFMQSGFKLEDAPRECQTLFSHADAEARFGASIFWLRDGMLSEEMAEEFLDTWQTKRDGEKRGIVEVTK
ncbi:MAG: hypothetical protein H0T87_12720 [Gammaproteobacteria bacterium]|nr:hypothetical protein [Gammaproteobacteria bacterium]